MRERHGLVCVFRRSLLCLGAQETSKGLMHRCVDGQ